MVTTIQNPDMQFVRYLDESGIRVSGFRMVTVNNIIRPPDNITLKNKMKTWFNHTNTENVRYSKATAITAKTCYI